jgi:glyoxylate reductase
MSKVFVTRRLPGIALDRLAVRHEVDVFDGELPPPPEVLRERIADAEGLICLLTDKIDGAVLDAAPRLRAIANYAVGYDNIDVDAATTRGIAVGNTPDILTDATADCAFALLLAAARRIPEARDHVLKGGWRTWEPEGWLGASVHGATLGIVGFGRIGRAVARRAEGFDMRVLTYNGPRRQEAPPGHDAVPLHELLERSDFVSLHCPLTPETEGMIDAEALFRMKPTAILVNTARGGLVDTRALVNALEKGEIAAAALDVTDPEPLPADHPLLRAPGALVVPHIASATVHARTRMAEMAAENILAALAGQPMPTPVNDPGRRGGGDDPGA